MNIKKLQFYKFNTVIVGSGAAGLNAALMLYANGQRDIAIITEGLNMGTSRNTGSDKQTYYKISLSGDSPDNVREMAKTIFNGGCTDGDIALAEAANSYRAFYHLVELGVPFPTNKFGEYIGYKTDHDPMCRGTSAGPYTSKYMTEALENKVKELEIPIFDGFMAIKLLTREENKRKRAEGIVALNRKNINDKMKRYAIFYATNIIWATGGEAGMYQASVYPFGQNGGTGVLLEEGAVAKNLTESQFGISSIKFRWNLSGSFQQCLPRYVSTDKKGGNQKEFLEDYFASSEKLINAIFLKGYQWPFDPRKVENEQSSLIDILVYQETIIKGRRVFLDFTRNPSSLENDSNVDFSVLREDARKYLNNCEALRKTPVERLRQINKNAIAVYMDKGIDLDKELLEISVCAQHCNGGIEGNIWWESSISHLFPIGEANGSHGVYRPGGTALNAGQVGGLRASQYIANVYNEVPNDTETFFSAYENVINDVIAFGEEFLNGEDKLETNLVKETEVLQKRMTEYGAYIRCEEGVKKAISENRKQWDKLQKGGYISSVTDLTKLYKLKDLLLCQFVYLNAIYDYIMKDGVSRGSFLVYNSKGTLPHPMVAECFRNVSKGSNTTVLQEICYNKTIKSCSTIWREVRPIPESKQWFESVWKDFERKTIYKKN